MITSEEKILKRFQSKSWLVLAFTMTFVHSMSFAKDQAVSKPVQIIQQATTSSSIDTRLIEQIKTCDLKSPMMDELLANLRLDIASELSDANINVSASDLESIKNRESYFIEKVHTSPHPKWILMSLLLPDLAKKIYPNFSLDCSDYYRNFYDAFEKNVSIEAIVSHKELLKSCLRNNYTMEKIVYPLNLITQCLDKKVKALVKPKKR